MVLSYFGSALQRERVSWNAGVKITSRSHRSSQPRYQGITLQLGRVSKMLVWKSLSDLNVPQKPKCSTYSPWTKGGCIETG